MARPKDHPFGKHYHVCYECSEPFIAATTREPYEHEDHETLQIVSTRRPLDPGDPPVWCGCDGSQGAEDKVCGPCAEELTHQAMMEAREYRDEYLIDGVGFADPGGRSALRAEVGGENGRCPSCKARTARTHSYCPQCGMQLNPRRHPCPECGARNVLTDLDKAHHYCCDRCADRKEGVYIGADY